MAVTFCVLTISALVVAAAHPAAGQQATANLSTLLDRAGDYVGAFEKDFALILGGESYEQKYDVTRQSNGRAITQRQVRKTRAEILFVWVSFQQWWLVVRNVLAVDGRPVRDSAGKFAQAFNSQQPDPVTELRRLRADSARHNLGDIYRDFNDPTLALQFVSARNRARFNFAMSTASDQATKGFYEVQFTERQHPTLLSGPEGDLPAAGSLLIQAVDGAIVRSRLTLADNKTGTRAEIQVSYRHNDKLNRWVPERMQESYQRTFAENAVYKSPTLVTQRIQCVASSANFRRFETSGRVLIPR